MVAHAIATIGSAPRTSVHPTSPHGRATSFAEKPQVTSGLISGGFFACRREIFDDLDDRKDNQRIVVGSLAGGMSFDEVQREYDLTPEDVRAALEFATDLIEMEEPGAPRTAECAIDPAVTGH